MQKPGHPRARQWYPSADVGRVCTKSTCVGVTLGCFFILAALWAVNVFKHVRPPSCIAGNEQTKAKLFIPMSWNLFTLSDPILVGDLGTEAKSGFFYQFGPDFF
jgi:hypothetical protein